MHSMSHHSVSGVHRRADAAGSSQIGQVQRGGERFIRNSRMQPQPRSSLRKAVSHGFLPQKRQLPPGRRSSPLRRSPPFRRSSPTLRRSPPLARRSSPPIRRSPSPVNRGENRFSNRARIPSSEKMRQFGGYKREFWSSDYVGQSTRSDAPQSSVFSHPVRKVQRGNSPPSRTSFHDVPVRRMSSDARIDNIRHGGIGFKNHAALTARSGPKMHKNYDDLLEGRDGRGDSYLDENYHGRPQLSVRSLGYEDVRDKPVQSGQFREMRPVVHGRHDSGGDGYRGGMSRTDWRTTSGRTYSDEEESRIGRRYAHHVGSEKVCEESKERGHDAGHRIEPTTRNRVMPPSRLTQAPDRPVARPCRAPARSLTSSERRAGPPEQKATPAGHSSFAKKGFGQDLRPEEILVTRNYQNLCDAKDFASKVLPGEERRVKIVRELSGGTGSARHVAGYVGTPKSQRSTADVNSGSSPVLPSKRSMVDLHGDTDDRILNNSMRSQVEPRQLRSSSHDFGDKDDRNNRENVSDGDSLSFESSDENSLTKKQRSESRDDEQPRERFDRKVNTRDPDDLRNSLARRRKMMKDDVKDRSSVTSNGLINRKSSISASKDSSKRRSSEAFPTRRQDQRDSSPKRRRLSESRHLRPAASAFKQPAVPPRRNFAGFHSASSVFRGRRFSSFAASRGRGVARDFAPRRTRPFTSRGFATRR